MRIMIADKEILLKQTLNAFFTKKRLLLMESIVNDKKPMSIRKLEWFVSIYCKKNNVEYNVKNRAFNVYHSYKNEQLKSFSKKYFDFFRRNNTFNIKINDEKTIETTVAQMNFFKWAFENELLAYMEQNKKAIDREMNKEKGRSIVKTRLTEVSIIKNKIIISFQ